MPNDKLLDFKMRIVEDLREANNSFIKHLENPEGRLSTRQMKKRVVEVQQAKINLIQLYIYPRNFKMHSLAFENYH